MHSESLTFGTRAKPRIALGQLIDSPVVLSTIGKEYTAIMPDGSERFAASFSMGRASLFYDVALLLEHYAKLPCGIAPDNGEDEHFIDASAFIAFFECLWKQGWILEDPSFILGWAAHAAGIIEDITLQPRTWIDRNGIELKVRRYLRPGE